MEHRLLETATPAGLAIPDIKDNSYAAYAVSFRETLPHAARTFSDIGHMLNNPNSRHDPIQEYNDAVRYIT
jgi:hypothetical protein